MATPILLGMNARLFPSNWRPLGDEIAFAAQAGFASLQVNGREQGIDAEYLGEAPEAAGAALRAARIAPVMEIVVRLLPGGQTATGLTPLDVLYANLPAVMALGCVCVHWHLAPATRMSYTELRELERGVIPQLAEAVTIAGQHGFRFGLEHNEPAIPLFAEPGACAAALAEVPGLGLVWDLNHTAPEQLEGYLALAPSMSMLHVSDTSLPETNYHLPVGQGSVDFAAYFGALRAARFAGPAILEIGGLPKSGGYGRDTDEALRESLLRLSDLIS
jgi:L-ribulose-5-phosphate 3-epimerase